MDIGTLELFVEVARRGSFSAVARDRGLDPSVVSRAIAGLERALKARLFQRSTRNLALTEAGNLYLARIAGPIEALSEARDEAASAPGDPAGTLRLTASVAFGQALLVPLLGDFRRSFPRLQLELLLTDANLDLVEERIDLAIRLAPSYRADVIGARLMATRYRAVASPAWLAAHGPVAAPDRLARERCLLLSLPGFRARWLFRAVGGDAITEVPVTGDIMSSSVLAVRDAALAGLGPALLADWLIAPDLALGRLVDLVPGHDVTATSFGTAAWLLYPSRAYLPLKVRLVIDFLRARLA